MYYYYMYLQLQLSTSAESAYAMSYDSTLKALLVIEQGCFHSHDGLWTSDTSVIHHGFDKR